MTQSGTAQSRGWVVAIDGPAGAGKSTAARRVAEALGYVLLDTGALYRGVALIADERGIPWDDGPALGELAGSLELSLEMQDGSPRLVVNGEDRADEIRTEHISKGASKVSRHSEVRAALLDVQREMGRQGGVVAEGRDIGTVVFPEADLKFYVTAGDEARARRRLEELRSRGEPARFEDVLADIRERDQRDSVRAVAPLKPAKDAVFLDTSERSPEEVVEDILSRVRALSAQS